MTTTTEANTVESTQPKPKGSWVERASWWILSVVALLQILAFSAFVDREIAWTYSFNFDQATYLLRAYEDFEILLTKGIRATIVSGLTAPVAGGGLLSLEASLLFSIFGMSRKVALGLHLAHWLVCQGFVFLAGRKIGTSAGWGLAGVGVLLALPAPMALLGGMFDFRLDLSAMALMGILAALVVLSDGFAEKKWSIWFGAVAIYSIWIRHLLLVYIGGGLGLHGCILLVLMARTGGDRRGELRRRFQNLCIAGGMAAAAIVSLLFIKYDVLYNYYYVGHIAGAEKDVRAAIYGATGLTKYTYYLESVIRDQMGMFALGLLALFAGWHVLSRMTGVAPAGGLAWRERGDVHAMAVLAAIITATYLVLSYDISKSPIVGNVFCVPVILAALLAARMLKRPVDLTIYRRYELLSGAAALLVLTAGSLVAYQRFSQHSLLWANKDEMEQVIRTHVQIGDYARKLSASRAVLFIDRNTDYQNAVSITVSNYEKTGRIVTFDDPVGGNVMLSDWPRFREHLLRADVALVTEERLPGEENAAYPTTRMFAEHFEEIKQLAKDEMTKAGGFQVGPHNVGVYLRPRITILGDSGDGWLTSKGVVFRLQREWLKGKKGLAVEGRTLNPEQVEGKLGGWATIKSTGQALPIYFSAVTPEYRMEIDTTAVTADEAGEVEIQVTFDRHWVPSKISESPDTRELVVRTPQSARLLTQPKLAWIERKTGDKPVALRLK